jgi:hypothetical protein
MTITQSPSPESLLPLHRSSKPLFPQLYPSLSMPRFPFSHKSLAHPDLQKQQDQDAALTQQLRNHDPIPPTVTTSHVSLTQSPARRAMYNKTTSRAVRDPSHCHHSLRNTFFHAVLNPKCLLRKPCPTTQPARSTNPANTAAIC